jgi:7,8-dihydro-6-hydroxymethylpterin-pyrophosphokinase
MGVKFRPSTKPSLSITSTNPGSSIASSKAQRFATHRSLAYLRAIESQLGSKKTFAKGPRLLDIDILLFGELSLDTPELQILHPRMLERKFVLAPLAEIAPQLQHPSWPATTRTASARSTDTSIVGVIS